MLVSEDKKIMRNKKFVGVLVFGVVCALVFMIVIGIYNFQDSACIDDSFCPGENLCFANGYTFCCNTYYSRPYTCGSYYNSCNL